LRVDAAGSGALASVEKHALLTARSPSPDFYVLLQCSCAKATEPVVRCGGIFHRDQRTFRRCRGSMELLRRTPRKRNVRGGIRRKEREYHQARTWLFHSVVLGRTAVPSFTTVPHPAHCFPSLVSLEATPGAVVHLCRCHSPGAWHWNSSWDDGPSTELMGATG
jgi:hypothetical protein